MRHDATDRRTQRAPAGEDVVLWWPTGSGLARASDIGPQRLQILPDGARGVALDLAVARNQRGAEGGQHRAAAIPAAGLARNCSMAADAVDFLDQVPGPLVGHVHRPSRGRDVAEVPDVLQQLNLARPDPLLGIKIDAKA